MVRAESSLVFILIPDLGLPIPTISIQSSEDLRIAQGIDARNQPRNRIRVQNCQIVKASTIDAKPYCYILLRNTIEDSH